MKSFIYILLTLIAFAGIFQAAKAQQHIICANDTLVLSAGNYQRGTMRWEKSVDMIDWQTIPNEVDTVYRFLPDQSMFYRCVSKFPDCPPEFSQITRVILPPVANAGIDRIVPGTQLRLAANLDDGESGQWNIIAGNGASLSDTSNPTAILQGVANETYTLIWTLGNPCGSSSDTLNVEFVTNQYFDNFVVVDTTDVILSTAAQIDSGVYIIQFSSPVPEITDSTVLIGMQLGGFLRMVQSMSIDSSSTDTIHTMLTTQATLDDITEYGAYSFGDFFSLDTSLSAAKNGGYIRLNRMPTRVELRGEQKYKSGGIHYYLIGEKSYMPKGVSVNPSTSKSGSALINFNFQSVEIVDTMGVQIILNGNYTYSPRLVIDRKTGWLGGTNYFKLGTSNSKEDFSVGLNVDINATVSLLDDTFTVYKKTLYYVIIIGTVPVLLDVEFALRGKAGAEAGLMINAKPSYQQTTLSSNYIEYKNGSWDVVSEQKRKTKFENPATVTGGLKQTFEIGPELSFNVYTVVGPYLSGKLAQELLLCASLPPPPFDWSSKLELGLIGKLGVKGQIFGKEFMDFYTSWESPKFNYTFPDSIEITMGNHRSYAPGSTPEGRKIPIQVKVHSNQGITLPMAKVIFKPESTCSVGDNPPDSILAVYADANGIASTTWTPGNPTKSRLKAYVLDCSGKHIKNSPLEFIAYADTTNVCMKSNLSGRFLFIENDTVSIEGKLGNPPYLYSLDSNSFTIIAPKIKPMVDSTYTFYVKDSLNCIIKLDYQAPDPCDKHRLTVSYSVLNDTSFIFEAQGGKPPYLFSLNPDSNFTSNNTFANLHLGFYYVFVKDSLGCVANTKIGVEAVQICGQIWMKHNLDIDVGENWWPIGRYCHDVISEKLCGSVEYRNQTEYGRLYDWYTVMGIPKDTIIHTAANVKWQGICPDGWRVPNKEDWELLINCIGGGSQGGKLQCTRNEGLLYHWQNTLTLAPNPSHPMWYRDTSPSNVTGFTARAAGSYHPSWPSSGLVGHSAFWWTASTCVPGACATNTYRVEMYHNFNIYGTPPVPYTKIQVTAGHCSLLGTTMSRNYGLSVRCVKW